jgi:SET domain-containing protein
VPSDAHLELNSSPGKGWGAFATVKIPKNAVVLNETPVFVIEERNGTFNETELFTIYYSLPSYQKQQLEYLGRSAFDIKTRHVSKENLF